MLLIALAAAAQFSAPAPTNLRGWFTYRDVPRYLLSRTPGYWQVSIDVTVDPTGVIRGCNISSTSGIAQLDALTCQLVRGRAKFRPARWIDGSASYGVYRTSVNYSVEGPQPPSVHIVMELTVNRLPAGVKSPALARVMFAANAAGKIVSCQADSTENFQTIENESALVLLACQQVAEAYTATPPRDGDGKPVPSVQNAVVLFSTQHQ